MLNLLKKTTTIVKENSALQLLLAFLVGALLGLFLFPTKRVVEKEKSKYEQRIAKLKQEHLSESESLKQEIQKTSEQLVSVRQESEKKILKLTKQVSDLKSKQKTSYYKLIKPDGTIEIKKFSESEVTESTRVVSEIQEEFKQKIESLEKKWSDVHEKRVVQIKKEFDVKEKQYQETISKLEKEKVTEINTKRFSVEIGHTTSRRHYVHSTADVIGPVFFGFHGEVDHSFSVDQGAAIGLGIGLRF